MNNESRFGILGGGIGGMVASLALSKHGFAPHVYEAAKELRPVGAGIILAPNAMNVFQKLGLYEDLIKVGNCLESMCLTDTKLNPIAQNDFKIWEKKFGVKSIALHRSTLHALLQQHNEPIHLAKRAIKVEFEGTKSKLFFDDGTFSPSFDFLIGSDGVHSMLRQQFSKKMQLRNATYDCWRGLARMKLPENRANKLFELWGSGARFGFVQLDENTTYWYFTFIKPRISENIKEYIIQYTKDFDPLVRQILEATPEEDYLNTSIVETPNFIFYENNLFGVIGDAAHPISPNLGQGACQAIEDGYCLAECLAKYPTIEIALKSFKEIRSPKVNLVLSRSYEMGKIAHLQSPILIKLRNTLMRTIPSFVTEFQNKKIYTIHQF